MNVIWIILAVLSFIGGQVYLVHLLRRSDQYLESRNAEKSDAADDDGCGNPDGNVIE